MDKHRWMVGHMIALIDYCEREGLEDVSEPLAEAMEKIAPCLRPGRGGANLLRLAPCQASLAAE
jgi:hypothetical protein